MGDTIQVSAWVLSVVGAVMLMLLGVIAFFMSRLLDRFDKLTVTVESLNITMTRDVALLKQQGETAKEELKQLGDLWGLARDNENRIIALERGGCEVRCQHDGRLQ